MRFILIMVLIAVVALVGLYIYGGMIEPETQLIEEEATGAPATGGGDDQ
ncbi:MAG: hypothetical protein AAGJ73_08230 [Pseudomonadota bacterium]